MCTGIKITATNGDIFFGRTMDLATPMFREDPGFNLLESIVTVPAGTKMPSQLNAWEAKYAFMGIGLKGTIEIFDGVNEFGLSGDAQVLKECTWKTSDQLKNSSLIPCLSEEFISYILTNFKSVAEIRKEYRHYCLHEQPSIYNEKNFHMPLHYTFIDPTGDGIVLEPVQDGEFKLYDFLDVVTNSPEYDYHQVNIRNYIGLGTIDKTEARKINDHVTLQPIEGGTGYGLFGLPGDYTSPSRFVRSFYLKNFLDAFERERGVYQLYAIFRSVMIPRGLEHASESQPLTDFSRYWVGYDITKKTLYVQTGLGLAFTSKKLDTALTEITYDEIDCGDYIHQLA